MVFTSRYVELEFAIEKALQGIPFSEDLEYEADGQKVKEPTYILPTDFFKDGLYGLFNIEGEIYEAPIGFSYKDVFSNKQYYKFNKAGNFLEDKCRDNVMYLPLIQTNNKKAIGRFDEQERFTPFEGSPFTIYGIEGSQGIHPFTLFSHDKNDKVLVGFYKDKEEKLWSYDFRQNNPTRLDKVREFLRSVRGKLPKVTAPPTPALTPVAVPEIDWQQPRSIVAYLDKYVIGQTHAKRVVAVAFSNYMTKMTQKGEMQKDNILLLGPSGVGKTYILSLLARKASLPMVSAKLTGKSTEGYVGENLSSIFGQMRLRTKEEQPYGIIFIDEIDKITDTAFFSSKIQDELIGWLEEAVVETSNHREKISPMNTKNILFVAAGAFVRSGRSLEDIIRKRVHPNALRIGFRDRTSSVAEHLLERVRPVDLIEYGVKAELVGRLPAIGVLQELTTEDKVKILRKTENSPLKRYIEMLELKGFTVNIADTVPQCIASKAHKETGARGLNAVCSDMFADIMFDPEKFADANKVITITPDLATSLMVLSQ